METLKDMIAILVVGGGILAVTGWMQHREAEIEAQHQAETACIPQDEGEVAIQRVVNGNITCEKHARVEYPQVQIPTLACPIKGACTSDNLIKLTRN